MIKMLQEIGFQVVNAVFNEWTLFFNFLIPRTLCPLRVNAKGTLKFV